MIVIVLMIILGVSLAYAADKLYLEDRFHRVALPPNEDVFLLEREPLTKILNRSELYESLRRTHEIHRGRSLPRTAHRRSHLAQAGDRGDGKGILPPGK